MTKTTNGGKSGYFQIKDLTTAERKAIRVGAAIMGLTMQDFVVQAAMKLAKQHGVIIEEGD